MRKVVLLLLLLVSITLVYAVDFPQWQDKYVNDFAGVLSSQQSSELKSLFAGVDSDTTAEVVFVSIADCGGDYDGYAIGLAKEWKIGKEDKDNGLLILYCPNESPTQRLFVATGHGLEGILPDSKVGRLLDESYVPLRDAGNFSEGIVAAAYSLSQVIEDNKAEVLSGKAGGSNKKYGDWILFALIILIFIIIPKILKFIFRKKIKQRAQSKQKSSGIWDALFWLWVGSSLGRSSGGGFGGGGFSGGGGFGGGSFGGGGAGR